MGTAAYDKANTTRINLKLNNRTDADIIQRLHEVPSIQGYIKSLIRNDMTQKEDATMTRSEIITKNYNAIRETMIAKYRAVLDSEGGIQYKIYIWSDGEIQCLEQVQGDNTYLQPYETETRTLHYVTTIALPGFDPWDYADHSAPEDEHERETEEQEITDWLIEQYEQDVDEQLDNIISEAEMIEHYQH